ncbi:YbhB/YbcL family Raf kinase inhibitor-like protein [Rhizobium leguminosarum]|uniref:YbhB/YbcL family Raf kinase inhibitor-like protein n=1 Tax=Rhizobium leguminosarum TaxID=384 RepID=UPI001C93EC69|nr:hypothetical protein [Rhizobium leguminosarum]
MHPRLSATGGCSTFQRIVATWHVADLRAPTPKACPHAANDFGNQRYYGPSPPEGDSPRSYRFRLAALDAPTLGIGDSPDVGTIWEATRSTSWLKRSWSQPTLRKRRAWSQPRMHRWQKRKKAENARLSTPARSDRPMCRSGAAAWSGKSKPYAAPPLVRATRRSIPCSRALVPGGVQRRARRRRDMPVRPR